MRKLLFLTLIVFSSSALASPVLICKTNYKVRGWHAAETYDFVRLTAYVDSDRELRDAVVFGAYKSDQQDVSAKPNYKPENPRYKNYNKFEPLEDAWHWFSPLLPKNLETLDGNFTGYVQVVGESGYITTLKMDCFLKLKN